MPQFSTHPFLFHNSVTGIFWFCSSSACCRARDKKYSSYWMKDFWYSISLFLIADSVFRHRMSFTTSRILLLHTKRTKMMRERQETLPPMMKMKVVETYPTPSSSNSSVHPSRCTDCNCFPLAAYGLAHLKEDLFWAELRLSSRFCRGSSWQSQVQAFPVSSKDCKEIPLSDMLDSILCSSFRSDKFGSSPNTFLPNCKVIIMRNIYVRHLSVVTKAPVWAALRCWQ